MKDKLGKAIAQDSLMRGALVVLLDRAGGSITYTEAEYQAAAARFGGTAAVGILLEVVDTATMTARLELVRRPDADPLAAAIPPASGNGGPFDA